MLEHVGKQIQTLRKEKGMTITALAESAKISRSLISQIESGYTVPSLPTLEKIINALGVTFSDFFTPAESESSEHNDFVVKSGQRKVLYLPDAANTYYLLSPTTKPNFEFLLTEYPPQTTEDDSELFLHEGTECFYILEGQIRLTVNGQTANLNAGDSGSFDAGLPHSYINKGTVPAKVIVIYFGEHL